MPTVLAYVESNPKYPGWYLKVALRGIGPRTAQVADSGNEFFNLLNFKDNETIEQPLFWALYRRGMAYFPDGFGAEPDSTTEEDWAELRDECMRRGRLVPIERLREVLGLKQPEVEAILRARGVEARSEGELDVKSLPNRIERLTINVGDKPVEMDAATALPVVLRELLLKSPEAAGLFRLPKVATSEEKPAMTIAQNRSVAAKPVISKVSPTTIPKTREVLSQEHQMRLEHLRIHHPKRFETLRALEEEEQIQEQGEAILKREHAIINQEIAQEHQDRLEVEQKNGRKMWQLAPPLPPLKPINLDQLPPAEPGSLAANLREAIRAL